jgi:TATA-box binding protein (TBP) (component of TFIID and TFIIIB)
MLFALGKGRGEDEKRKKKKEKERREDDDGGGSERERQRRQRHHHRTDAELLDEAIRSARPVGRLSMLENVHVTPVDAAVIRAWDDVQRRVARRVERRRARGLPPPPEAIVPNIGVVNTVTRGRSGLCRPFDVCTLVKRVPGSSYNPHNFTAGCVSMKRGNVNVFGTGRFVCTSSRSESELYDTILQFSRIMQASVRPDALPSGIATKNTVTTAPCPFRIDRSRLIRFLCKEFPSAAVTREDDDFSGCIANLAPATFLVFQGRDDDEDARWLTTGIKSYRMHQIIAALFYVDVLCRCRARPRGRPQRGGGGGGGDDDDGDDEDSSSASADGDADAPDGPRALRLALCSVEEAQKDRARRAGVRPRQQQATAGAPRHHAGNGSGDGAVPHAPAAVAAAPKPPSSSRSPAGAAASGGATPAAGGRRKLGAGIITHIPRGRRVGGSAAGGDLQRMTGLPVAPPGAVARVHVRSPSVSAGVAERAQVPRGNVRIEMCSSDADSPRGAKDGDGHGHGHDGDRDEEGGRGEGGGCGAGDDEEEGDDDDEDDEDDSDPLGLWSKSDASEDDRGRDGDGGC